MNYRLFGHSGLRVSEVSLGTMTFGEEWGWGAGKDESRKIYDAYREAGGNFIDTANVYTNGTSETLVGDFIRDHRQSVVLATKYTNAMAENDPNAGGNHRKNMMQAVEGSLRRLKTDYVDLYWLHIWDRMTPVEEVMRAFDDLVRQGKVLYVGVSDAPAWWIAQANTLAELRGWTSFIGLQIEYSLIERTVERELIPMAKAFKLGLVAWSPLGGGVLSGKYQQYVKRRWLARFIRRLAAEVFRRHHFAGRRLPPAADPPRKIVPWLRHVIVFHRPRTCAPRAVHNHPSPPRSAECPRPTYWPG